ncbi:MAG TPA: tetratricopeptide repeat protein [Candidatus Binatia bacterium]|jgi:tetratricopeptide (TPR) repeat protein|nr:tetratricopeptide repeat protein [Candidatus Binatia bacterium]
MRALVLLVAGVAPVLAVQAPPGSLDARRALALCGEADHAAPEAKRDLLERSLALAETAVKADDRDPQAHFAVFCALGKQTELKGLSPGTLGAYRRVRREVDRALELAPDYVDALTGKGALLIEAPRLFGGDPGEAERLLRRAIALDPEFVRPRLDLARALDAQGRRDAARGEAAAALALAERKKDSDDVAAARKLVARLGGGSATTPGRR